jgi:hypothetical protein
MNCGVLRCKDLSCCGAPHTDMPMMLFDETDLHNAVALNLLEKRKIKGSYKWEWYAGKKKTAS